MINILVAVEIKIFTHVYFPQLYIYLDGIIFACACNFLNGKFKLLVKSESNLGKLTISSSLELDAWKMRTFTTLFVTDEYVRILADSSGI